MGPLRKVPARGMARFGKCDLRVAIPTSQFCKWFIPIAQEVPVVEGRNPRLRGRTKVRGGGARGLFPPFPSESDDSGDYK